MKLDDMTIGCDVDVNVVTVGFVMMSIEYGASRTTTGAPGMPNEAAQAFVDRLMNRGDGITGPVSLGMGEVVIASDLDAIRIAEALQASSEIDVPVAYW
ncbi:Uncharacterised protein (plasmid) [Tsukamurella tyrosinosolvens]|uniref:Uncharacterized protein n=1 Tax=Tsukamurella tyrosinosolvens TaxID=57704 RepID=A0A1H4I7N5_TSUTY|nr:hypothetical protein [Tsukamurella tyrosinosolvens]KXO98822.1 hypothetical protein AXK58_24440 [Tsukamurella tyrosinosolvens]SEB29776.1 hypothetical protein SAMN04489793_0050 [Tsukamurella tyrosinosolvens]VEH95799.1 Uncharacterised protein [Tsukamurella tyrosinosolvens]